MAKLPNHAKKVFEGIIFDVHQWEQELFDGSHTTFEMLGRPDSVVIIPVLEDKRLVCIEDTQPYFGTKNTFPAGRVEHGEAPEKAALRELQEETGLVPKELVLYGTYEPVTKIDWTVHIYIARSCVEQYSPCPDAGEQITIKKISLDEILVRVQRQEFLVEELLFDFLSAAYEPLMRSQLEERLFG